MDTPHTNRFLDGIGEKIESSAELLAQHLNKVDYRRFIKVYFYLLGILCATIFSIIVTVRLALSIF